MGSKRIAKTMIVGAFATALQMIISLILTPMVTNQVGVEAYGYVTLAKTFTSYADIIMIALNAYASRYISISYLSKKKEDFDKYYSTVFFADLAIGGCILLAGLILDINLTAAIRIPDNLVQDVKLLFLLTFIAFFLTTLSTSFSATAYATDDLLIYNAIRATSYIAQIIVLYFSFNLGNPHVWYVGIATTITALVVLLGCYFIKSHAIPEARIRIKDYSKEAFGTLVKNGIWNSVNSLGNTLNSGLDLLITNLMLTATGMGQLSISKTITSSVAVLYGVIAQPYQPKLLQHYANNDKDQVVKTLIRSMQISGLVTNVILAGFCAVGEEFFNLWIPTQDTHFIYILTILALLPAVSEGCVSPLYYIYTLTVKNKIPCFVTIIGGLTNIVSMYFLIKYTSLGLYAVLLTTAVIMNFINLVTNPLYMTYCLKVKKGTFYPQILRNVIALGVSTVILYFISSKMFYAGNWGLLIVKLVVLGTIGLIVQIPFQFDKEYIIRLMGRIRK